MSLLPIPSISSVSSKMLVAHSSVSMVSSGVSNGGRRCIRFSSTVFGGYASVLIVGNRVFIAEFGLGIALVG